MAEENRNGFHGTLEAGASAAHAVRGAVKAGKAVSGAAKGAAMGGPYGAAAGALWEGRKHIGKIAIAAAALLLLPVVFITMLPGLIFGGFSRPASPSAPETPILNSEAAIMENANAITFSISSILGEGMDDVLGRINADFAASDGDGMEVINPYAADLIYNANLFVSQYCAAREKDISGISITDMENVLRGGISCLYSFSRAEETRDRTETDPGTGKQSTITEKWMVYTIAYNGEDYFADRIFSLTDKQKALATDYARNLSLFLGDGLLQNFPGWDGDALPSLGDVHFTDGAVEVTYYSQLDKRYAAQPYGTDHVGGYGCGPASMAMVVSSLTDRATDPAEMAEWSYKNGYWCKGSGSYHALIPGAAESWGLTVSGCTASEPQRILDALADGKLVVAIMSKGHFTSSGHFIVLRGVKDGKVLVADPASQSRSGQGWDLSTILNEASRHAGAGGPFWIIGQPAPDPDESEVSHEQPE
ncbi:MAG: C39 family peptidase [Lachnospiraceae bacterium]|nr:C39 family peptidase [Lachnospiraceae bacterium]MCM1239000.1 C39 family peptidase [Lachnospiraceae bacterium]